MKITESPIESTVNKAVATIDGSSFQLEEVTEAVERNPVNPGLLTALLSTEEDFITTDSYRYDASENTATLPAGKSYSDVGPDIAKDKPFTKAFDVPSFGIRFNVLPADYANRRKKGTMEFLTEADVVSAMQVKADQAWDLHKELGLVTLLTTDTNIVMGGPFTTYNFYTDIVGSPRPAAQSMQLNAAVEHEVLFRKEVSLLSQDLAKAGGSSSLIYAICGDNFFNLRYNIQKNEGLAREIKFGPDLATQNILNIPSGGYNYQYFDSNDGIRYVNYGAEIIAGEKLIADDDAYLVPTGGNGIMRPVFAPAQTRQHVNTQAQALYSWAGQDDRAGVVMNQESNVLYSSVDPRLVRHLTI